MSLDDALTTARRSELSVLALVLDLDESEKLTPELAEGLGDVHAGIKAVVDELESLREVPK